MIVAVFLGFLLGAALQLQQAILWSWVGYACLLLPAVGVAVALARRSTALHWRSWQRGKWQVLLFVAMCVGLGSTGLRSVVFDSHRLVPALEGRDIIVTGVVADMPRRSEAGLRFTLDVASAQWPAGVSDGPNPLPALALPRYVDVGWYSSPVLADADGWSLQRTAPEVHAGERWQFTLRLKAPHGSLNPYGFDYELALWEQGVQAVAYVRAGKQDAPPQRLGSSAAAHPVAWARQTVRERIVAAVPDARIAGLIAALVVGDQAAIERSDWDVFRATGVAHLVSISGLHITLFAWLAACGLAWGWRRSQWLMHICPTPVAAAVGGVLLAGAYAVFAGWGVPAQRTCIMLASVAVLRLAGLRWPWPMVWLLACTVVVAVDPWALMQGGFWLSFVAVGVLFAMDSGDTHRPVTDADVPESIAPAPVPQRWVQTGWTRLRAMLREQWIVTVALAPLTLLLFGQVSVVGLLANMLAIPWVTLVVTPLSMLGVVWSPLWDAAALSIAGLMACLQWLAAIPWATWSMAQAPGWLVCGAGLGVLLMLVSLPWSVRGLGVPLVLALLLWQPQRPAVGAFSLLAADIGQGNAVLVQTAHHALLFDTGPRYSLESDAGHRVLLPLLAALGVRLDTVVLSHRDIDHVGGAAAVLQTQAHATLLSSIEPTHPLQQLRAAQRCEAGQQWTWDGVQFEVLHPRPQDYANAPKPNAISCVLRIKNTQQTVLLTGDIEKPQEGRLVAGMGHALHADVLLVPHHGSKTSSSADFLDAVSPRWAVVQAGYRNRFGHPAAPVMERYAQRHIAVVDSPHCGAWSWRSDAPEQPTCYRDTARRYWHHTMP